MKIGGFQKTSLLDYPDKISAIIWTAGCNFRCPFCYNKDLVLGKVEQFSEDEILSFLKMRKNLLEGLVISGGEPLMQEDISEFITKVKKMGFLVKIDTNGMFPEKLQELIDKKLVDYIAMDVKAPLDKYDNLTGVKTDIKKIKKSIEIIKNSGLDYEFKTTFVPNLLNKKDIKDISELLRGSKKFFLQQFKNTNPMISSALQNAIETLNDIKQYFDTCKVRGL